MSREAVVHLYINISSGIDSAFKPYLDYMYYASQVVAGAYTLLLVVIFIAVVYIIYSCETVTKT